MVGSKQVWNKGTKVKVETKSTISNTKLSLAEFVANANSAKNNSLNQIPNLDSSVTVRITPVQSNLLAHFVTANSEKKFSFIGPTPLPETDPGRAGAVSLITKDQRAVYQSQSALPPWAATFKFTTTDPQGRFVVVTSGQSNQGDRPYSWRLVFKSSANSWKYQSIAGTTHANDGKKNFDEVSLGSPGTYSLRLEFESLTTFYGVGTNDETTSVTADSNFLTPRVVVFGDSWVYPVFNETNPVHVWDAFPGALSWLTGWNVISSGVPGQGYLQVAAGETYKNRVARDLVPQNPDVVIFTGSPNDHCQFCTYTDQQIANEMGNVIKSLQKANPNILIVACSPFDGSHTQAQAMQAVAVAAGIPFINFVAQPLFDANNNGKGQLGRGHPSRLGSAYIANQLLKSLSELK
jgi:lysophospholipase L1-like esterase